MRKTALTAILASLITAVPAFAGASYAADRKNTYNKAGLFGPDSGVIATQAGEQGKHAVSGRPHGYYVPKRKFPGDTLTPKQKFPGDTLNPKRKFPGDTPE